MGMGYFIKCTNRRCRYSAELSEGFGFGFSDQYANALKAAKSGAVSEAHRRFFEEHPEGALNAEEHIYQCGKCGHLFSEPSYSLYLPKDGVSVSDADDPASVLPWELPLHYKLAKRYVHHCPNCGGRAKRVKDPILEVAEKCPRCGSKLRAESIMWD